ncbi:hypothetical protein Dred_2976 [Desulforamulus reducens MI-1]|uniref:Uncharacterized protein n=1 Tax=Desulforamulus reducens (strain ATCC BAA-1160 / DSM 100696 / MI-1) TaxID=349161 RepID=A4J8S6_DESRM|nr:hypothetical protein [Desulforamulus reducens]ABO51479.1 hypothetical protein Dred_2976 [Desulforamulus reducens MI-1]
MKKIIITMSLISSLFVASTAFAANDNSSDRSNYVEMLNNCKAALKQSVGTDWKTHIEMMKDGNCPECGMTAEECTMNME